MCLVQTCANEWVVVPFESIDVDAVTCCKVTVAHIKIIAGYSYHITDSWEIVNGLVRHLQFNTYEGRHELMITSHIR